MMLSRTDVPPRPLDRLYLRLKPWVLKKVGGAKKLPSATQMQALRDKFDKPKKAN